MSKRVAVISATWHGDLLEIGRKSFLDELSRRAFDITTVDCFTVPGALEIPLMAQMLAQTGRFAVIVALGFVVDGGIYRHEFVASAVIQGLVEVGLKTGVPVLSAVLTPHHFHSHETHESFFRTHLAEKGRELAGASLHTLQNLEAVEKLRR